MEDKAISSSDSHDHIVEVEGDDSARPVAVLKGEPFTARVRRPIHAITEHRRNADGKAAEEVLRVRLTLCRRQFYHMNLFINLPSASAATPIASPEFASAFNHIPLLSPEGKEEELFTTLFSIGISDIVSQLGLSRHPHLLVTFVPTGRFKDSPVIIDAITIDLE